MQKMPSVIFTPVPFTEDILREGVEFQYEPGNGTRFDMVLVRTHAKRLLVCVTNFGVCHDFAWHMPKDSVAYVAEKLKMERVMGDAAEMTKLIDANLN